MEALNGDRMWGRAKEVNDVLTGDPSLSNETPGPRTSLY